MLYRRGYFEQEINLDGMQKERYEDVSPDMQGITPAVDAQGNEIVIAVDLPGRKVYVKVWKANVGRARLLLMDTNLEANQPEDREITKQLYANEKDIQGFAKDFQGKRPLRLEQEIVLGIAGERALNLMEITPDFYHINEGHVILRVLEALRGLMSKNELSLDEALEVIRSKTGFTLHTPVPAGNEMFDAGMALYYLGSIFKELGLNEADFREIAVNSIGLFDMSKLALFLSGAYNNGVSQLHGNVSQTIWQGESFDGIPVEEVPIGAVTNSVHVPYWQCREIRKLIQMAGGIEHIELIPDEELWETHVQRKRTMIEYIRNRKRTQIQREFNHLKSEIKDDHSELEKLNKKETNCSGRYRKPS